MMVATVPLEGKIGFGRSGVVGYTIILLSFLLVFFGIRSYRDNVGEGHITFGKAFAVGLSITLITCACYVLTWEILYFNFLHDFMDKYSEYKLAKLKASGASAAALQAKLLEMNKYQEMYENPLINAAMTFMEPLPVGLVITLLSAVVLRKKPALSAAPAALRPSY